VAGHFPRVARLLIKRSEFGARFSRAPNSNDPIKMKIKIVLLSMCVLVLGSINFAQSKTTAPVTADQVIRNLYAAQKTEQTNPFVQVKSRAAVDKYFAKDLADMIWKINRTDSTAWRMDPLYNSQDPQITGLVVGKPNHDDGPDSAYAKAAFKDNGKNESVGFTLQRGPNKVWKISDIDYSDGETLRGILNYQTDAQYMKDYDNDNFFKGNYMVGPVLCLAEKTMNGMFHRVTCDGQDGLKLYGIDGDPTKKETQFVYSKDGKEIDKFVFKDNADDGRFIDASGKEVSVTRVKTPADATPTNPGSETVNGELILGKTESVILCTGMETGDYAAYCFPNASEAGRAILAKCKKGDQCELSATLGDVGAKRCKVPGLKASLSAEFRITKVASVKSLGRRK
jgi:hypothetical protein